MKEFECKRCGTCCRWSGYVYLSSNDVAKLGDFLKIGEGEFIDKYTQLEQRPRLNLKMKETGECIFLDGNDCSVYPARPWQCESFPVYWRTVGTQLNCPALKDN